MGSNNRWNWEVAGFEPRKSVEQRDDYRRAPPVPRRYSMSVSSPSDILKQTVNSKLVRMNDKVKLVREDYLELRQEAMDLQEYSSAKLDRVTRYLGVLADKTRKLDQAALETEARIFPLLSEKKRLFNDLLTAKGNVKMFCRVRPLFEEEGPDIVEFPDDYTLRINTEDDSLSNPKKDFEFDRVYGPHVGQADLFADIQPFVQSAFDGFNVSVLAYGQTASGKTHTMEGSSHDRGLYARSFEELFDLSNSDATSTSRYSFSVSVFELYNEQITDLLLESGSTQPKVYVGSLDYVVELVQEKVENPIEFNRILKTAFHNRGTDTLKFKVSHLIVIIHTYYTNLITGDNIYSKLSLVDLPGSESTRVENEIGEHATELLHVLKSLLASSGDICLQLKKLNWNEVMKDGAQRMTTNPKEEEHLREIANKQEANPVAVGWLQKIEDQYKRTREHAETYPYVWASYILVYGGFGMWLTYRWRALRKMEDKVRALQEKVRKQNAEVSSSAQVEARKVKYGSSTTKPPPSAGKVDK